MMYQKKFAHMICSILNYQNAELLFISKHQLYFDYFQGFLTKYVKNMDGEKVREIINLGNMSPERPPGMVLHKPAEMTLKNHFEEIHDTVDTLKYANRSLSDESVLQSECITFQYEIKEAKTAKTDDNLKQKVSPYNSYALHKKTVLSRDLLTHISDVMGVKVQSSCSSILDDNQVDINEAVIPLEKKCDSSDMDDSSEDGICDISVLFSETFQHSNDRYVQKNKKNVKKRKRNNSSHSGTNNAYVKEKKTKKNSPNYFLAIQVNNKMVHSNLKVVQDYMLKVNPDLKKAIVPVATLHLTIMVMYLEGEEDINKAVEVLKKCEEKLSEFITNPIELDICGIGNFKDEVIFAKCAKEDQLQQLADKVIEHFKEEGIKSTDNKGFKPHMTILKLSKAPKLRKKGIKKVDSSYYSPYQNSIFGRHVVANVQLCSMLKPKDKLGYYHVEGSIKTVSEVYKYSTLEVNHLELIKPDSNCLKKSDTNFTVEFENELKWIFHERENSND